MRYYVDGYNLMFRLSRSEKSFSLQRERMITSLRQQAEQLQLSITVVFDAYQTAESALPAHVGMLEVRYTATGETADEWISSLVADTAQAAQITVVTSDRALATRVRQAGALTISVEAFTAWIYKRCQRKAAMMLRVQHLQSVTPPPTLVPPEVVKKPKLPTSRASFDSCLEYYLHAFGDTIAQEPAALEPPSVLRPNEQRSVLSEEKPTVEPQIRRPAEDWLDYYQRIFEQKIEEEE